MKETITAKIFQKIAVANQKLRELGYSRQIPETVKIEFLNRASNVFGRAKESYDGKMTIQINIRTAIANPHLIDEIISHEVSHLACFVLGRRGHDMFWSRFDRSIGGKGNRLISGIINDTRNFHTYACRCGTHNISTRKHNLIQKEGRKYICCRCGTRLEYVDQNKEVVCA